MTDLVMTTYTHDVWEHMLTPSERTQLTPLPRRWSFTPGEKLVIDPAERPWVHKTPEGWQVVFHRSVVSPWTPDAITYDSWAKAVLAALHDVRDRLAAWVSTHDGLTDF